MLNLHLLGDALAEFLDHAITLRHSTVAVHPYPHQRHRDQVDIFAADDIVVVVLDSGIVTITGSVRRKEAACAS